MVDDIPERRQHTRVYVNLDVAYRVPGSAKPLAFKEAWVANVSEGGLLLLLPEILPLGTILELRLTSKPLGTLVVEVEVIRVETGPSQAFRHAVRFVPRTPEMQDAVDRLVAAFVKRRGGKLP